jgi:hypothetical protein
VAAATKVNVALKADAAAHTHPTLLEIAQVAAETAKKTTHAAHTQTKYRRTGTCDVVPAKEPSKRRLISSLL